MEELDNLLIFDVFGPLAHFRKYYTNSSSLSYFFPPRTVITGLIAGLIGRERDSYYEELGIEQCRVAVGARSQVRKVFQTVNYLLIKNRSDLNGKLGHTQIPLELIMPAVDEKEVRYRIYFSHQDQDLMKDLTERLYRGSFVYPPYLGLSEFIATVQPVALNDVIIEKIDPGIWVELSTICNINCLEDVGLDFQTPDHTTLQYMKEKMPVSFNKGRQSGKVDSFIFEKNQEGLRAKLKTPAWKLKYNDEEEVIVFMEG